MSTWHIHRIVRVIDELFFEQDSQNKISVVSLHT